MPMAKKSMFVLFVLFIVQFVLFVLPTNYL